MTTLTPRPAPRPLGSSGLSVSPIAWGMWRLSTDGTRPVRALVDAALETGITLFDTAAVYGFDGAAGFGSAEETFGRALAEDRGLRDRMVIATKGGIHPPLPYDSARLEAEVDASLRRLRIDVIDLYQVHRRDSLTHPRAVAAALDAVVAKGKVRCVGVSNHGPAEVDALRAFLSAPIVSTQPEFSPLHADPLFDGTLDQAMARDMAVLAWSPLAGGRLLDEGSEAGRLLAAQGARHGADAAAAALSWAMVHPAGVIPIVGSQSPGRLRAAADAFRVGWTRADWYAVLSAGLGRRLP